MSQPQVICCGVKPEKILVESNVGLCGYHYQQSNKGENHFQPKIASSHKDLNKTEEYWYKLIDKDNFSLKFYKKAPFAIRDNENIAIYAVKKKVLYFKYISKRLKENRDFIKLVLKKNTDVFGMLSEIYRNDKELYEIGISSKEKPINMLVYAGKDILCDKRLVELSIEKGDLKGLNLIHDDLKNDKELILKGIKLNANVYEICSENLKNDKSFAIESLKTNSSCYNYFKYEFRLDKELIIMGLDSKDIIYSKIPSCFKDDKEIILKIIKKNPYYINSISDKLKKDKEILLEVLLNSSWSFQGLMLEDIPNEYLNDEDFIMKLINRDSRYYRIIGDDLLKNYDFIVKVAEKNYLILDKINEDFKNDPLIMLNSLKNVGKDVFLIKNRLSDKMVEIIENKNHVDILKKLVLKKELNNVLKNKDVVNKIKI